MSGMIRGFVLALCVASAAVRSAAARDLPYFLMGPTIPFSDEAGAETLAANLGEYGATFVLGFGTPSAGAALIARLRAAGILVGEDAHGGKVADAARVRNREVPYCMAGEYQSLWLKGLEKYVPANDCDFYAATLDEEYWNNLFLGYGFGAPSLEDAPVYSHSPEFLAGFEAWCEPMRKRYNARLVPPETGRSRIFAENTLAARLYAAYRYDLYARSLKARCDAVKAARPGAFAYTVFSAVPTLSMERYPGGIAWDVVGRVAQPDFMTATAFQTFPDYKGRETHLHLTETACHLEAANRPRPAGIVMAVHDQNVSGSRLGMEWPAGPPYIYEPVRIRAVDVVGQSVSYAARGLRGVLCFLSYPVPAPKDPPWLWLAQSFRLLREIEPLVAKSAAPRGVAFLHSRVSEDVYSLYRNSKRAMNADDDGTAAMCRARGWAQPANRIAYEYNRDNAGSRGFRAQKNLLHFLVRESVPFEFFFLESVAEKDLEPFPVVVVPFPFSVSQAAAAMLDRLCKAGKTVVVYSEFGSTDEFGVRKDTGTGGGHLLPLIGASVQFPEATARQTVSFDAASPILPGTRWKGIETFTFMPGNGIPKARRLASGDLGGPAVVLREEKGGGRVVFLGGDFAVRAGEAGYREINRAVLEYAFRGECPLTAEPPAGADTEIALRVISPREALLFAVNWDDRPREIPLRLRLPAGEYAGTVHRAGAAPEPFAPGGRSRFAAAQAARMRLRLGAGESRVIHIRPAE